MTDSVDHELLNTLDLELLDCLLHRCQAVQAGRQRPSAVSESRRIERLLNGLGDDAWKFLSKSRAAAFLRHAASAAAATMGDHAVAMLGPTFSYSHLAAIKHFGEAADFRPVASIGAVFESVAAGDVETGVVPVENSTDGRVVDTLSMFLRHDVTIVGEAILPIHHCLLSKTARSDITEVHSKPQAISQCRGWLSRHFPNARLVETASTAGAAESAASLPGVAAIASIEAGRLYELDVIDADIEDNADNVTRFAVLGSEPTPATGDDKTTLLFQIEHAPGALADTMQIFKAGDLNLTWIESFPFPGKPNEYLFFVELGGHAEDPSLAQAIGELRKSAPMLKVLGAYPRGA